MEPFEIHVRVSPDDEVLALRSRVAELEAQLSEARAQRDRAEYRFGCECAVNQELVDLCREHGIAFRAALSSRPW